MNPGRDSFVVSVLALLTGGRFAVPKFLVAAIAGLSLTVAGIGLASPAAADGHEQVVFSGEGDGSFGGVETEVGFWIWCALDESGDYDDCSGTIQFDDLHLTRHVEGEVSEPEEGVYVMDVASSDGSVVCTLTNDPPVEHGPHNTVTVTCSSPQGSAVSTTAVVIATG
jgi:hypothetical protein